ncbi:MAG: thiolase family protein, partial [Chloroflexi bacterium]|nr:thiolase family protein [Chloroflexota bacterium]
MREVVIVEAVRTPMGRRNGVLSGIHPNDLGAKVLNELIKRSGIEAEQVEDVVFGCVDQVGEQGANVARNVLLTADFPYTVPATSVDRQCGSGQQAVHFAANLIQAGVCDITIGGGVESMSRVPLGVNIMQGPGAPFQPSMMEKYPLTPQGISAEEIAVKWGVKRQEADEFALNSQEKAKNARDEGRFDREMLQIDVKLEGLDHTVKT